MLLYELNCLICELPFQASSCKIHQKLQASLSERNLLFHYQTIGCSEVAQKLSSLEPITQCRRCFLSSGPHQNMVFGCDTCRRLSKEQWTGCAARWVQTYGYIPPMPTLRKLICETRTVTSKILQFAQRSASSLPASTEHSLLGYGFVPCEG